MPNDQLLIDITKCSRCGKCTALCPMFEKTAGWDTDVARGRVLLAWGLARGELEINDKLIESLYRCPACGLCEQNCTAGVKVGDIVRDARALLVERGAAVPFSHRAAFDTIARMTLQDGLKRDWRDLIQGDFEDSGQFVYFSGVLPYLEPLLDFDLGVERILSGAVKLFNQAQIKPAILRDLADSGHDAFWSGQYSLFQDLKEKNSALLSEAKTVVTNCAEDYYILKSEYSLPAEVYHISQFVSKMMKEGKLSFRNDGERVTFHDPCRLGRHMGEYDAPREVLRAVSDYREMARYGANAACCGVGAWMNCNKYSRQLRLERIKEAAEVADILVTACSKCLTHFRCLLAEPEKTEDVPEIKIIDFTEFVASKLVGDSSPK